MAGEDNYGADATAGGEVVPLSEEAEVAADGAAVGSGANGGAHEPAEGETTRAGQEPGAPAGEGDQTAPASDRRSNAAAADRRSDDQGIPLPATCGAVASHGSIPSLRVASSHPGSQPTHWTLSWPLVVSSLSQNSGSQLDKRTSSALDRSDSPSVHRVVFVSSCVYAPCS